jgi:hypothetical protein
MADLAIITSLYRSNRFLPGYLKRLHLVTREIRQAGLAAEVVLVANDPSARERALLARLAASPFQVTVLEVPRETLYASWNRGIQATTAPVLAPWNVDDIRTGESFIEGCRLLGNGPGLVYFPFAYATEVRVAPFLRLWLTREGLATPFHRETFRSDGRFGPFMMFTRRLYETTGPFDAWFRVWGDVHWVHRAVHHADFLLATSHGGTFRIHGRNLGWPADPKAQERRTAERNVLAIEYGAWEKVTALEPAMMRATWEDRKSHVVLPDWMQQRMWGPEAQRRWDASAQARHPRPRMRLPGPRRIARALGWRLRFLASAALHRPWPDSASASTQAPAVGETSERPNGIVEETESRR